MSTRYFYISAFLVMTLGGGVSLSAQGAPDTGWLYKVDTRPPKKIFIEGFYPRNAWHGSWPHTQVIGGFPTEVTNMNYEYTTTDRNFAHRYATYLSTTRHHNTRTAARTVFVYLIRPTTNFYQVFHPDIFFSAQPSGTQVMQPADPSVWATREHIRPAAIYAVRTYIRANDNTAYDQMDAQSNELVIGRDQALVNNPRYLTMAPVFNTGMHPFDLDIHQSSLVPALVPRVSPEVPVSLSATAHCLTHSPSPSHSQANHRSSRSAQFWGKLTRPWRENEPPPDSDDCSYIETQGYYESYLYTDD